MSQERKNFHERLHHESKVDATIQESRRKQEEAATEKKAKSLGVPYLNLKFVPVNPEALQMFGPDYAKKAQMVVFQRAGVNVKVGLVDPQNKLARRILQHMYQEELNVELYIISPSSLQKALNTYEHIQDRSQVVKGVLTISQTFLDKITNSVTRLEDFAEKVQTTDTSDLIQLLCAGAIATESSDIHIEPTKHSVRLRYRIDGVLQDILQFDREQYKPLINRIKSLASLILNRTTTAQDGRFSMQILDEDGVKTQAIDVRVSILPGKNGEIIVMRILNSNIKSLDLHTFGFRPSFKEIIIRNIENPQGMVILSGPTGSGKTTSLYGFLNYINHPETNIVTIEDPIEYHLPHINQTQIDKKKGYDFASGLRAIVRQDPDVIMVGEIRDEETAQIAINSAVTGHLVFSTIHTNDAVGITTRFQELGVKTSLITSASNLLIAQRLVRKLCETCKRSYQPTKEEREYITKALAVISPKAGISIPQEIPTLYKAQGCPECHGLGYKGRLGIFELFEMKENVSELINEGSSEFDIFRKAIENGMITLFQDGVLHALQGETSMDEIFEVAGDTQYIEDLYDESLSASLSRGIHLQKYTPETTSSDDLQNLSQDLTTAEQLQVVTALAWKKRATDIHIEPTREQVVIRFRIDGVLHEVASLPRSIYPQLLSQIKIMSGLPVDVTNQIQEGRFTIFGDGETDVRVSIIPGGYGQTMVLRLLQSNIENVSVIDLGMDEHNLSLLQPQIKQTSGLVLVTGPTSAGKSTTLYATLNTLNQPGVKIITIEDPIEYNLSGILQTSIDKDQGYTFASALRALLRQNPNIILIGEIRDQETAQAALQAAATGHLLLSTLHTNNSVGAILRLHDLGIGLQELSTLLNAVVAQRIIRTLDDNKSPYHLSAAEQEKLKNKLPQRYHDQIPETIYQANPQEESSGYHGMTAIFEVLVLNEGLKEAITDQSSNHELQRMAIEDGMTTLEVSGILKVLQGETDIAEVERVLGVTILS